MELSPLGKEVQLKAIRLLAENPKLQYCQPMFDSVTHPDSEEELQMAAWLLFKWIWKKEKINGR